MAFLRALPRCGETGCSLPAAEELLTFRNELWGSYCKRHAVARLRLRTKEEEKFFSSQRNAASP